MIGLAGAHRTGKTTLAKRVSEEYNVPMITSSASQVFKDLGLDPAQVLSFEDRMRVQNAILDRFTEAYRNAESCFITDRTPYDCAAYTLADINQNTLNEQQEQQVLDYLERCYTVANTYLHTIVVIPPVIPFVAEEGKPLPSRAYQRHIHHLIVGMLGDERNRSRPLFLYEEMVDLDARVMNVGQLYDYILKTHANALEGISIH